MRRFVLRLFVIAATVLPGWLTSAAESPIRVALVVTPSSNLPGLPAAFVITVSNDSDSEQKLYGDVSLNVVSPSGSFKAVGPPPGSEVLNLPHEQMDEACDRYCLTVPAHGQREVVLDFGPRLNENPFFWDRRLAIPGSYVLSLSLSGVDTDGNLYAIQTNTQPFTVEALSGADLEAWTEMKTRLGVEWGLDLDPRVQPQFFGELRTRFPSSRYAMWTSMYGSSTLEYSEITAIDAALAKNPPAILRDNLLLTKAGELASQSGDVLRTERNLDLALSLAEQSRAVYKALADVAITARMRSTAQKGLAELLTRNSAMALLRDYERQDPPAAEKVVPFVECIQKGEKSAFVARFGYENPNSAKKVLPLSNLNEVTPAPRDQGQPRVFRPGRNERVFEASSPGGELIWHLDGRKAIADGDFSVQCSSTALVQ